MKSLHQQISDISNLIKNCNSTLQNGSATQIKDLYDRLCLKSSSQTDYLIDVFAFSEKKQTGYKAELKKLITKLKRNKDVIENALSLQKSIQKNKNIMFDFIKILGFGGNGTVYLVNEKSSNTQFALKQLRLKDPQKIKITKKQLSRFNDEITVVTHNLKNNHGILPINDFYIQSYPIKPNDFSWYTMPLATPIYNFDFKNYEQIVENFS